MWVSFQDWEIEDNSGQVPCEPSSSPKILVSASVYVTEKAKQESLKSLWEAKGKD